MLLAQLPLWPMGEFQLPEVSLGTFVRLLKLKLLQWINSCQLCQHYQWCKSKFICAGDWGQEEGYNTACTSVTHSVLPGPHLSTPALIYIFSLSSCLFPNPAERI